MVDSISGAGGPQNITPIKRNQDARSNERAAEGVAQSDNVSISSEASDLNKIEDTAREARAQLADDPQAVLTRGQQIDTLL